VAQQDYAPLVRFSDESDQLLETGGGLKKAQGLFDDQTPILIHNVDILDNVDYGWFSRQHLPEEDAVLLVSRRQTKRYLLFDSGMRLMGWINRETGEVKSPFPWLREADVAIDDDLNVVVNTLHSPLHAFAFSGIHSFSPRLFPLMDRFPDRFPIIDFYLSVCHRSKIMGVVKNDLQMLDVGKLDSLEAAERFAMSF
jgi:NDP-sugar pyrophosphorylase family protein